MTPELQAHAGDSHLADHASSISPRLKGAIAENERAADTAALSEMSVDRPPRNRAFHDGAAGAVAAERVAFPELPLGPAQIDQLGALFKLLSDRTRLAVLQLLCQGEMNVTAICRRLKLPQPTVSHHLGLLRMSRLIANRRNGKQVYYRLHERLVPADSAGSSPAGPGTGLRTAPAERAAGLRIVDAGFCLQISAGAAGMNPSL